MMKTIGCLLVLFIVGCAASSAYVPNVERIDGSLLPEPDVMVSIPHLGACTDADDPYIQIHSGAPITVLVHGCNGSAGRFRSLAQLFAFYGKQTVCFEYNDRDSLFDIAEQLADSLDQLSDVTHSPSIYLLGHSLGGLIARKALERGYEKSFKRHDKQVELITVSAPFAGISAAKYCGMRPLHWFSLGIVPGICWMATGDNWFEITSSSDFIKYPQSLTPSVQKFLKIVTNEANTCRRESPDGRCLESDDIFRLSEQYHPTVDSYPNVIDVKVDAGHVEIVGDKDISPKKLLSVLQAHGLLPPTPAHRKAALESLLARLYCID